MADARIWFSLVFVCVFLFPHYGSKTDAAGITKLDIRMFHDVSWKPIYLGIRRSQSWVTKTMVWVFALIWVLTF